MYRVRARHSRAKPSDDGSEPKVTDAAFVLNARIPSSLFELNMQGESLVGQFAPINARVSDGNSPNCAL
jgi:hypothetical protein